jgi:hypothetical protein
MASPWLKARQTKYAAYATTYILVVLAVVVVANYLGNRYSKSWDATANKRYSLSQETKKIVDGLKSPATITYFNVSTRFVEAKDILDEYTAIFAVQGSGQIRRSRERADARARGRHSHHPRCHRADRRPHRNRH